MKIKKLLGSGDKIMLFTLPFIIIGIIINILFPEWFNVGGPFKILGIISIMILLFGIIVWIWSIYLISTNVPQNKLITSGPYSIVRHPLYTGIALLIIPWSGFLLNSWLGILIGASLYGGCRLFAPKEEKELSKLFGGKWEEYKSKLLIPWL